MKVDYMQESNVVAISPIRARINFPAIGRVEAYWEGLRNGRLMPMRSEIDPRGIADVLEFAFVLERVAPGLARMRLAGMHLNELMAMEVRGMPLTAIFLPEARREMQDVTECVMETPAAVRVTLASDSGLRRAPLEAQIILLPMRDEEGRATRILGALQTRGEIGHGPRRFTIRDVETKVLEGLALPEAAAETVATPKARTKAPKARTKALKAPAPGLAEPPRPSAPRNMELADRIRRAQKNAEEVDTKGARLTLVDDADQA